MKAPFKETILDKFYKYRFYLLFLAIFNNYILPPFHIFPILEFTFKILSVAVLLFSGVNFIEENRKKLRLLWFIYGIVIIGISYYTESRPENVFMKYIENVMKFSFFLIIIFSLLRQIFAIKKVTKDVLLGAFCGYFLIGINCFFVYMLIDIANPQALYGLHTDHVIRENQIFYFTFTCLSTLGFGDIVPTTVIGQKMAVFTAAIGQFYIAVVVAILISRFMHFRTKIED